MRLVSAWLIGLLLLTWALWLAVFGGAAALLARISVIRKVGRVPSVIRIGIVFGLVLAAVILTGIGMSEIGERSNSDNPFNSAITFAFKWSCVPLLIVAIACLRRPSVGRLGAMRRATGTCSTTTLAIFSTGFAVSTFSRGGQTLAMLGFEVSGPIYQCIGWSPPPYMESMANYHAAWPGLSIAPCLFLLFVLAIASLVNKIPLASGIVQGFKRQSFPLASAFILAWLAFIPYILEVEREARNDFALAAKTNISFLSAKSGLHVPKSQTGALLVRASGCH